jgi:hypothetical protein
MRNGFAGLALSLLVACSASAQTPPPPSDLWKSQVDLFVALPRRFPAADMSNFARVVSENVEVQRENKVVFRTRKEWFDELQSYKQSAPSAPQGFSVSRDQYSLLSDGGIMVREFTYPIAPEGETVFYHPNYPLRYVTYYVNQGKLFRVIYGPPMTSYAGLCQVVEKTKGSSAVTISSACN